jgi:4-hydroxy-tetrahydrodipicolinate reductase
VSGICIAGGTGWTGRALVDGVLAANDLELRSAVARSAAGEDLGLALGRERLGVPVHATVAEALEGIDVLIDFTSHDAVKAHALAALERATAVVIGSSGLTAADFEQIDAAAREHGVGVIAAGNFSITAAAAQAAALLAARHLPHWEVIDYATDAKADVPSGTSSSPSGSRPSAPRPPRGRPTPSPGRARRAARASRARRCTRCGCPASCSPPR